MLRTGGARLQTAQELAGHHTARMTEHYTHDSERAVLALPDMSGAGADAETHDAPPRPTLSLAELKAAIAGLTAEERAALLGA